MSTDSYNEGDRVFVKLRGYPPWPALVKERIPGTVEYYNVFFYGTYDWAKVRPDVMYPFSEETKAKFSKPPRTDCAEFKQAMDEIENKSDEGPELPPSVEIVDEENHEELVVDEAVITPPPPPPVLKPGANLTCTPTGKKEKEPILPPSPVEEPPTVKEPLGTPPPAKQRRSKGGKNDLGLLVPDTREPSPPFAEVVSRSGRKIKPKKFADEEVLFSTRCGAKLSSATEEGKSEAKRRKRTRSIGSKTLETPIISTPVEMKPEVKTLPPLPALKPWKRVVKQRVSPMRNVSDATTVFGDSAVAIPVPSPVIRPRPPPSLRPIPGLILIPVNSSMHHENMPTEPEVVNSEPLVAEYPEVDVENKELEVKVPEEVEEEDEKVREGDEEEDEEDLLSTNEDPSNPPVPGGDLELKEDALETDDEGTETENSLKEEEPMNNYENGMAEVSGTGGNVLHAQSQSELNGTVFLNTCSPDSLSPTKATPGTQARVDAEELKRKKMIEQLVMEGEILEAVGELVGCLGTDFAKCDQALDLLDKIGSRTDITALALKKNPEVVTVIGRIRNYHGNVAEWPYLHSEQIEEFHVKAEMIRDKAVSIHESFKLLFCSSAAEPPSYENNDEGDDADDDDDDDAEAGTLESEYAMMGLFDYPAPVSD